MNSIIWLATLGVLFVYFFFMTPVKPPAAITLPQAMVMVKKGHHEGADKNAVSAVPAVVAEIAVQEPVAATEAYPMNPVDIEKGKAIYLSTCIKCHNKDPNVKGAIGPELVDAPLEIMQAKVATGRYPDVLPEGFVPKRKTKQMVKQPQALPDVPSIHAYVQSLKKN